MKKELEDFNAAAQALAEIMIEANEFENKIFATDYPFNKDFDELSYEIHLWASNAAEDLYNLAPNKFVVCKDAIFGLEEGWWYRAKSYKEGEIVKLYEEINVSTAGIHEISYSDFEDCFFEVPEEMYRLYEKLLMDGRDVLDLIELATKLYDKKGKIEEVE